MVWFKGEKVKQNIQMDKRLAVSGDGVFFSIQGEGVSMGLPSCFLRLHLCNLKCKWCDSWYTWDSSRPEFLKEQQKWTLDETKKRIEDAWTCKNEQRQKRLVITGGEPLIQQGLIERLLEMMPDWFVEIETNGTIMPSKKLLKRVQFNCSPKLKNSGNKENIRFNKKVLLELSGANTFFKFVVSESNDIKEVEEEYVRPLNLNVNMVVIMPQGITPSEVRSNALKIVDSVKEKGYRLLTRLHVNLWGNKRKI